MSNGFEARKEQSKAEIRKAAWELFGQFGVEKVSVADIARRAGVSPATIYNNFGSKDALTREFVIGAVDQLVDGVEVALARGRTFSEKMEAFVRFLETILIYERPSQVDATIFSLSNDLQYDSDIRRIRESAQEKMTGLLLRLVEEGKEQAQVDQDVSEEALRVYFAAFMDLFTHPELQHQFYAKPKMVQDLGSLMMHGLTGKRG